MKKILLILGLTFISLTSCIKHKKQCEKAKMELQSQIVESQNLANIAAKDPYGTPVNNPYQTNLSLSESSINRLKEKEKTMINRCSQ